MTKSFSSSIPLPGFKIWQKIEKHINRNLYSFDLELTARCNNNCKHCFINLPANDLEAKKKELSLEKICDISDQALEMGALWCLITGGEPLLRDDFFDIYMMLKKKGLLVSVFTNACLITQKHVDFFKKYPPRDIEITVYGVTKETYEKVTRINGSFNAFMRGLDLLMKSGIKIRFKSIAIRSNLHEFFKICKFCRKYTKDYFFFDHQLSMRVDQNPERNLLIQSERLSPEEIVALERADNERFTALKKGYDKLMDNKFKQLAHDYLFRCSAGSGNFYLSYDGYLRLCTYLCNQNCIYDLKKGTLKEAWESFVPRVRNMRSKRKEFLNKCGKCDIISFCFCCPAHAFLESGEMDVYVDYFCKVAHARFKSLTTDEKLFL